MNARHLGLIVLVMLLMVSAIGAVYAKHRSRGLFVELRALESERDAMNVEWHKLQLEEGTVATHGEIERKARELLGMRIPVPGEVVIVRP